MFDIVIALQTVLNRSAKQAIDAWLGPLPKGAAWHLISDYVFGDPDRHDTAAFVLLLHHGRLEEILEYINNQAPVDIKKSRSASEGLIRYLRSPVAFSYTFVLDKGDAFFKTCASLPEMIRSRCDREFYGRCRRTRQRILRRRPTSTGELCTGTSREK